MLIVGSAIANTGSHADWPGWRGPAADGRTDAVLPIDLDSIEEVWTVDIPGRGGSTPVIDGDTIYLTSGVEGRNRLIALDATDGSVRFETEIGEDAGNKHRKGGGSNSSPVVADTAGGRRVVVAYFRSGDLAGVDAETGDPLWRHNVPERFGQGDLWWDRGNSPCAFAAAEGMGSDGIVLPVMETGIGYVLCLDAGDGSVRWKSPRPHDAPRESGQSYTTPVVLPPIEGTAATHVAVLGADVVTAHRLDTGDIDAVLVGLNPRGEGNWRSIASPVVAGPRLIVPYGRGETSTAINVRRWLSDRDAVPVDWVRRDVAADVMTPAADGEDVIVMTDPRGGVSTMSMLDGSTGQTRWSVELSKSRHDYSASPLVAGRHVYAVRDDGHVTVVGPIDAPEPDVVSRRRFGDGDAFTVASAVPIDGNLLIRTRHHLHRIGAGR